MSEPLISIEFKGRNYALMHGEPPTKPNIYYNDGDGFEGDGMPRLEAWFHGADLTSSSGKSTVLAQQGHLYIDWIVNDYQAKRWLAWAFEKTAEVHVSYPSF